LGGGGAHMHNYSTRLAVARLRHLQRGSQGTTRDPLR